jgi:hypothetical protein
MAIEQDIIMALCSVPDSLEIHIANTDKAKYASTIYYLTNLDRDMLQRHDWINYLIAGYLVDTKMFVLKFQKA